MFGTRAVSVVVPTFNRGPALLHAVHSATSQRGVDVEVLVCDDGSRDDSEDRIRDLADARVRWLPGIHSGGPAAPRNRGIAAATHPWVAFLDSDDTWRPDKLQSQLHLLEESRAASSATNARRVSPGVTGDPVPLYERLPPQIHLRDELAANLVVTSSMLVKTDLVRRVGGFPQQRPMTLFEDYALWLRVAQAGPIAVVDELLVDYRDDPPSSLRGRMSTEFRCTANALRDFMSWRRNQKPRIRTTPGEVTVMMAQLARLLSLRCLFPSRIPGTAGAIP